VEKGSKQQEDLDKDDNITGIDPVWAWEPYLRDKDGKIRIGDNGQPIARDALLPASRKHDLDYVRQKEDRLSVDRRWLRTSLDIARRMSNPNRRRWTFVRAGLSYAAIRSLGWLPWYARRWGLRR
jgi:hypothetical protein